MSTGLARAIKLASLEAMENAQMCDLRYGEVVGVSPLKVKVTNNFIIPSSLLVVPEHLTDRTVDITLNWETDTESFGNSEVPQDTAVLGLGVVGRMLLGKGKSANEHSHTVSGTKTMTIHGALKLGDKVALLRKQGGQSYFILDRI